jgi:hypothetical protein
LRWETIWNKIGVFGPIFSPSCKINLKAFLNVVLAGIVINIVQDKTTIRKNRSNPLMNNKPKHTKKDSFISTHGWWTPIG